MSSFLNPVFIVAILIALSVHEWAHAYAAYRLGDPTAKYAGRMTLNPLAHIDALGAFMFLFVGFGWGKPVPVDPRYLKNVRRDSALISLAGPLSNFVMAWIAFAVLLVLGKSVGSSVFSLLGSNGDGNPIMIVAVQLCQNLIFINLALMSFNLIPIAPLDGSKILYPFIPLRYQDAYENIMARGPMLLIALLVLEFALNVPLISRFIFTLMSAVLAMMGMIGNSLL
ncbi:MAG: site-2 protease family protein [Candidatus Peribacteraceae bacterium]|nr:site-2 protease family protein [Candidatus Peribacteraceae bacterium]